MEISVLVEQVDANGFRATGLGLEAAAEAPTREAALERLRRLIGDRLGDAELVRLEIPLACEDHPWKPLAGRLRDHPDAAEIERHLQDYRRDADEQGDRF